MKKVGLRMIYPCEECLVRACCCKACEIYFDFVNYWAENLGIKTADEIHEFRMSTPAEVKHTVSKFYSKGMRFVVVRDKDLVAIRIKDKFWNCKTRKEVHTLA